jgi:hypothetical protein
VTDKLHLASHLAVPDSSVAWKTFSCPKSKFLNQYNLNRPWRIRFYHQNQDLSGSKNFWLHLTLHVVLRVFNFFKGRNPKNFKQLSPVLVSKDSSWTVLSNGLLIFKQLPISQTKKVQKIHLQISTKKRFSFNQRQKLSLSKNFEIVFDFQNSKFIWKSIVRATILAFEDL